MTSLSVSVPDAIPPKTPLLGPWARAWALASGPAPCCWLTNITNLLQAHLAFKTLPLDSSGLSWHPEGPSGLTGRALPPQGKAPCVLDPLPSCLHSYPHSRLWTLPLSCLLSPGPYMHSFFPFRRSRPDYDPAPAPRVRTLSLPFSAKPLGKGNRVCYLPSPPWYGHPTPVLPSKLFNAIGIICTSSCPTLFSFTPWNCILNHLFLKRLPLSLSWQLFFLHVSCSVVSDSVTPWTAARQAPLSLGFSRQEHRSGLPFPSPGHLPNPGIQPGSPTLQADSLPSEPPGKLAFLYSSWNGGFSPHK